MANNNKRIVLINFIHIFFTTSRLDIQTLVSSQRLVL